MNETPILRSYVFPDALAKMSRHVAPTAVMPMTIESRDSEADIPTGPPTITHTWVQAKYIPGAVGTVLAVVKVSTVDRRTTDVVDHVTIQPDWIIPVSDKYAPTPDCTVEVPVHLLGSREQSEWKALAQEFVGDCCLHLVTYSPHTNPIQIYAELSQGDTFPADCRFVSNRDADDIEQILREWLKDQKKSDLETE